VKRLRNWSIATACLAFALPAAASAEFKVGVNAGPYLDQPALTAISQAKLDIVRAPFFWRDVQPTGPLVFDWASTDSQVLAAARTGVYLDVVLAGAPEWALVDVPKANRGLVDTLPSRPTDFAAFAEAVVRRYGPTGTLWAANPDLKFKPIRSWQIWNEPNLTYFAGSAATNPVAYANLFDAAVAAINRADPRAVIWLAGVARGGSGNWDPTSYLKTIWTRFGRAKAVKYKWAVHVYSTSAKNVSDAVSQLASAMARKDSRQRDCYGCRLVLGEFGWSSSAKASNCFKCLGSESAQNSIASSTLSLLRSRHSANRLDAALWYTWRDATTGQYPHRMGVTREDGTRKPVLATLTRYAAMR